jgi:Uma2 family endonuclease
MSTKVDAPISVDEYLSTSYSPDCEYVDGAIVERNVGDWRHARAQGKIVLALGRKYPDIEVVPELRMRTIPGRRFRIPDVTVVLQAPETEILETAPFIAIEILSKDDRMSAIMEKLEEYHRAGAPNIWVFDPRREKAFTFDGRRLVEVEGKEIFTEAPEIRLALDEVFQQ